MTYHHHNNQVVRCLGYLLLILWMSILSGVQFCAAPLDTSSPLALSRLSVVDAAFRLVSEQQDLFHKSFIVYDDRDSGNEHFFPSGWTDDIAKVKGAEADTIIHGNFTNTLYSGSTCIQFTYPGTLRGKGWGGVFWEFPENKPLGPGYDLSRYKFPGESIVLRFAAKADTNDDYAEFAFRHVVGPKTVEVLSLKTNLTIQWHEYEIDLSNCALTNVTGGFAISTIRAKNKKTRSIYADNIRIEFGAQGMKRRLNEPHFVRSYIPEKAGEPDMRFRSSCFSYDNSLMAIAYCARGEQDDLRRAQLICDAFVEVQNRDQFADGRIRNGYSCGDIIFSTTNQIPRLPGWWDDSKKCWFQEEYCAATDCGNMAWTAIALLDVWEKCGRNPKHLQAALQICEWVNRTYDPKGIAGYCGGVELVATNHDYPDGQRWVSWKSCEHNIDIYVAFKRLACATGNDEWNERAELARNFVLKMVEPTEKHLWTGTGLDGSNINKTIKPLDVNPWALLALRDIKHFGSSVGWAETNCSVIVKTTNGSIMQGFDFKSKDYKLDHLVGDPTDMDEHGIWWEGTAQMHLAFQMLGKKVQAEETIEWLRFHANTSLEKGAVLATTTIHDGLATGFRRMDQNKTLWVYWNRPHVGGATCWYIFAELGWNPYWGRSVNQR